MLTVVLVKWWYLKNIFDKMFQLEVGIPNLRHSPQDSANAAAHQIGIALSESNQNSDEKSKECKLTGNCALIRRRILKMVFFPAMLVVLKLDACSASALCNLCILQMRVRQGFKVCSRLTEPDTYFVQPFSGWWFHNTVKYMPLIY